MSDIYERKAPDLSHPDSCIRLASAVHRFRCPQMSKNRVVSFVKAFTTAGKNPKTQAALKKADVTRAALQGALSTATLSHERIVVESKKYLPLIHQILITCKVQPESARLDQRLVFEWTSGMEQLELDKKKQPKEGRYFASEALMYDMVMCMACEGLGKAGAATEASLAGEFAMASRDYAAASGIFQSLAEDHLPQWIARGTNVDESDLPVEVTVGVCRALSLLFLANGQQMAVATVLIKPGTPNYSLLAKLSRGIVERLESFVSTFRKEGFEQMSKIDKEFFNLVTFQTQLHKSLALYFQARSLWENESKYGLAIAILSEATKGLKKRPHGGAAGMPELTGALHPLSKDLADLQSHMGKVLKHWEDDNSSVYFEGVPQKVPSEHLAIPAVQMTKPAPYVLADVEPLLLKLPASAPDKPRLQRTDSDLARELQEKLNSGMEA